MVVFGVEGVVERATATGLAAKAQAQANLLKQEANARAAKKVSRHVQKVVDRAKGVG